MLRRRGCASKPPPPRGLTAQWYRHELYGGTARACGAVRERDVYYAVARLTRRTLECVLRLTHFWRAGLANGREYLARCREAAREWQRGP